MGILSSEQATFTGGNLLDTLCAKLEKLMSFGPGERDLVMLQHKFVVEWLDGNTVSDTHVFSLFTHANFSCRRLSLPLLNSSVIRMVVLVWLSRSALHVESLLSY